MARIFIAYSRKDEVFAHKLAKSLSDLGADIWIDVEDIPAGMNWSNAIQQGLRLCEIMIVIITPASMASRNVEEEWQYYHDKNKPLVPILLKPTEVHYQLSRIHYIDFHKQDYDLALRQLHSQLRQKGVALNPISASEKSVPIPAQRPLPVRGTGQRRLWVISSAVAASILLIAILAVLSGSGQGGQPTPASTLSPATQGIVQVATTDVPTDMPPIPTLTPTDVLTAADSPAPEPTLDIVRVVETLDAQSTASVRATNIAASATQVILFQQATETEIVGATASAALWTDTPTPDITASIDALMTQRADDATATATLWTPTSTSTPSDTLTPDLALFGLSPDYPVTRNADWTPVIQDFDGFQMALVPVGCFMMGSEDGDEDEQPVHEQCFDAPFWIDVYEVTNAAYGSEGAFSGANRPRERVTWFEARDFCQQRGARLPTEAEWEYAARGLDSLIYPWGNDFVGENVIYAGSGREGPAEVGSRPGGVSWVGAMDMSGNVWEWTSSLYRDYPYNAEDGRESNSDDNNARVLRGGSWSFNNYRVRAAFRSRDDPSFMYSYLGFRCVRPY